MEGFIKFYLAALLIEGGVVLIYPSLTFKWKRVFGYFLLIWATRVFCE